MAEQPEREIDESSPGDQPPHGAYLDRHGRQGSRVGTVLRSGGCGLGPPPGHKLRAGPPNRYNVPAMAVVVCSVPSGVRWLALGSGHAGRGSAGA
jgi:hypothetical protein